MKRILAFASFIVAAVVTFIAICLPPPGSIEPNVLFAIGQFLVLCATMAGVGDTFDRLKHSKKPPPTSPFRGGYHPDGVSLDPRP